MSDGTSEGIMHINNLMNGREAAAEILHTLACEVEEGCTSVVMVRTTIDPFTYALEVEIKLVGTPKHEDDLLRLGST